MTLTLLPFLIFPMVLLITNTYVPFLTLCGFSLKTNKKVIWMACHCINNHFPIWALSKQRYMNLRIRYTEQHSIHNIAKSFPEQEHLLFFRGEKSIYFSSDNNKNILLLLLLVYFRKIFLNNFLFWTFC